MHRTLGRWLDCWVLLDQLVTDLRSTPGRVVAFKCEDGSLDLKGQLVSVSVRSSRAVLKAFKTALFIAIKNLGECQEFCVCER